MKVLVVDDSKLIRAIVRNNLEQLKITANNILEATDGESALRFLSSLTESDLVITDLEMPKMNGTELVARIRAHKKLQNIKIVACSSSLSDTNVAILHQHRVDDLIRKPFDADTFMTAIRPVIDGLAHKGKDDNGDRFVDIRADFLNAFKELKPNVEVVENDFFINFKGMSFRISIDNLIKNAVVSYPESKTAPQ